MAYQNVGTPRFYINAIEWMAANDVVTLPSNHYRTLPVNPTNFVLNNDHGKILNFTPMEFNFIAVLGHVIQYYAYASTSDEPGAPPANYNYRLKSLGSDGSQEAAGLDVWTPGSLWHCHSPLQCAELVATQELAPSALRARCEL